MLYGGEHCVECGRGSPKNKMKVSLLWGERVSEQPSLRRCRKWTLSISVIFLSPWLHHDDMPRTHPLSWLRGKPFPGNWVISSAVVDHLSAVRWHVPENSSSFNRSTFKHFINLNRARICHKGELASLLFPFTGPQQFHNTHRSHQGISFLSWEVDVCTPVDWGVC